MKTNRIPNYPHPPFTLCVAILILFALASSAPAALVKGPYLIYPGVNTQMEVLWQLDATTPCTLEWGTDTQYRTSVATTEYGADHQHKCLIGGLTPGRKYYYRVREGANTYPGTFLAAPSPGATTLKFFAYGDTRINIAANDPNCAARRAAIAADPAYQTLVLLSGDWVGSDSETAWAGEFFARGSSSQNLAALLSGVPFQGCAGNHDLPGVTFKKYWPYPYVSNMYWSFDYGPAHFAVIDQYDILIGPSDAQVAWLQNDLAKTTRPWKFLIYHEPAWTAQNPAHPDNTRAQEVLQPLCVKYGVDLCFNGHVHAYVHCVQSGVHHLTLGGGGAPLYGVTFPDPARPWVVQAKSVYNFARIAIDKNVLRFEALQPNGTVIDSFTITHPVPTAIRQGWQAFK